MKKSLTTKIKRKINDETGITLVELLAALSLLSVVILLAGSIHMFGQRQFKTQADSASRSNDLSYALSVMSTDIRKMKMNDIRVVNDEIFMVEANGEVKEEPLYHVENNQFKKENQVITDSVSGMDIELGGTYSLVVTLYSDSDTIPDKEYQTTIVGRGEYYEEEPQSETE